MLNKVMAIGNLGRDPEMRQAGDSQVANFAIAVTERRQSGEHTEWVNCVAFGKTAQLVGQYLTKGQRVFVEGRLQTRKWEDKEGRTRQTTEVIVQNIQFLSPKSEGSNSQDQGKQGGYGNQTPQDSGYGSYQDDLPF